MLCSQELVRQARFNRKHALEQQCDKLRWSLDEAPGLSGTKAGSDFQGGGLMTREGLLVCVPL